ncbi:LysR substrate-binding domain-containing protein [Frigoriglobus tundricola]|nr:LysR substrate-binding domain-containing protein [Frigoriglobus tundricola]
MELRHLRYFIAVAEELNFTRAALRVGIGQPPLSQQIRDLEKELGASLFRRLPHGVELTRVGEAFLPEARAVLDQANRAARTAQRASRGEYGRLRVGFTGSAAFRPEVPAAIRDFRRRYPHVDLTLEEAPTADLIERLMTGDLDAAFVRPGRSNPEGMRVRDLGAEAMMAVLPAAHRLARSSSIPFAALAGEPLVLFPRTAGPGFFDAIMEACRRAGFEPVLGSVAPQLTSVANLVAAGMGVSVVPESVAQVRVQGVRYRRLTGEPPVAHLVLVTRLVEESIVVSNFLGLVSARG